MYINQLVLQEIDPDMPQNGQSEPCKGPDVGVGDTLTGMIFSHPIGPLPVNRFPLEYTKININVKVGVHNEESGRRSRV